MTKIYLDYNATTPVDPLVQEAMLPYFGNDFGNPSSFHWAGSKARKALEESREKIASLLSCKSDEITFTSGGTEANNLALLGIVGAMYETPSHRAHVITTQIEHQSVLAPLMFLEKKGEAEVTRLRVNSEGNISLEELKESIKENTILLSIMFANNEIGNIYPMTEIGKIAREKKILFHTDAVQAVGKLPINLSRLPVDLLSFSSHKIYGPKGVGALYVRKGTKLKPLVHGGSQEMEKRGGTQNLPGIVGFAQAMDLITTKLDSESLRLRELRGYLERGLMERIPNLQIHGDENFRVSNTLNVTMIGITSETILIALDREGIAVSSGSACASGAIEPSHVLLAMGVPKAQAKGAIRFSLGQWTTQADVEYVLEKLPKIVERLRS